MKKFVKVDQYEKITDLIIEMMEQGVCPWERPWNPIGEPMNYSTGKEYRGINNFFLNCLPFEVPYYMTFKQCQAMGGKVKKGSKGAPVFFFKWMEKENKESGEKSRFPILKSFTVFNISQIEGIEYELPTIKEKSENDKIESCEELMNGFIEKPIVLNKNLSQAYYSPMEDIINMPMIEQFKTSEFYYSTLFHEIGHWTGAGKRMERDMSGRFGSDKYAKEELVAEMFSAFACNRAGIDKKGIEENRVAYLKGWVKRFKEDKKMVMMAASAAQKAFDCITGKTFEAEAQKAA